MNHILLDTNAYSNLLRGNTNIQKILDTADVVYMSVVVIGELLAGYKKGKQEMKNRQTLTTFLKQPTTRLLTITLKTAHIWSEIMDDLRSKGKPIPINDIWIASQAKEVHATLVTFDGHFSSIRGLQLQTLDVTPYP